MCYHCGGAQRNKSKVGTKLDQECHLMWRVPSECSSKWTRSAGKWKALFCIIIIYSIYIYIFFHGWRNKTGGSGTRTETGLCETVLLLSVCPVVAAAHRLDARRQPEKIWEQMMCRITPFRLLPLLLPSFSYWSRFPLSSCRLWAYGRTVPSTLFSPAAPLLHTLPLLTLDPGWQELSLGWAEPEGGNPVARPLRFSRRQVSITPQQQAGVNRENRRVRVRVWPLLWFLCQHHTCARTTQLYSIWSDLYGISLLITMIVIRLFSWVAPMSTELKYNFSKCRLFLLIVTCGFILCPYSSFSNSTFTSDFTANLLLSKSVHGTVFSSVHGSVCFGQITQYCQ